MCDLEGLGLADDRQREGKDARRGQRSVGAVSADDYARSRGTGRRSWQADRACGRSPVSHSREVREPAVAHAPCCGRGARGRGVDRMKTLPVVQPSTQSADPAPPSELQTGGMISDPERTAALRPRIVEALSK